MSSDSETPESDIDENSAGDNSADEGAGCLPAILAASILSGIAVLVICAFGTWFIYQNRDQIALRSVRGAFIPAIEQSLLDPEEKAKTVELLDEFADEIERGRVESWQASGVMQRLTRLPILQWGQLRAVEQFASEHPDDFDAAEMLQFRRLRKGVERDKITTIDFGPILSSVVKADTTSPTGTVLADPMDVDSVDVLIQRAKIAADRADVPAEPNGDVTIDTLVRRQIEAGIESGSL